MSAVNKILLPFAAFLLVFSLAEKSAEARRATDETSEEDSILFRIENIKPIANADGLIEKCSFVVTTFNRMDKAVKEAKLDLNWEDNISAKYAIAGNEVKAKNAEESLTVINTSVEIENIPPHFQKSFEGVVETDKCFLLLDNLEYTVEKCILDGEKQEMKNNKVVNKNGGCERNFNYINSANPEYYTEFKDVPESVLTKQADEEKKHEVAKIDEIYNETLKDMESLGKTLEEIK